MAADLGASLVFLFVVWEELETPAFSLSGELLSSHDISSEATCTFMETEGFRQSPSICVSNLLCGHGDHKENLDIPVRAFITQAVGLGSRRLSSLDDWAGGRNFDLPLGFLGAASHVVFKDRGRILWMGIRM